MDAREAATKSSLSIAKRYGSKGHLWIWNDTLGGFRGTDRLREDGQTLVQVMTEEEIEAHDDWEPMMSTDVDPADRPTRKQHNAG